MSFLAELLVRGAALSALVLLIGTLPGLRKLAGHGVMVTIALAWLVALPILVLRGPRVTVSLLPAERRTTTELPREFFVAPQPQAASASAPVAESPPIAAPKTAIGALPNEMGLGLGIIVYLVGAAVVLLWQLVGAVRIQQLVRRSRGAIVPADLSRAAGRAARRMGLGSAPALRVSSDVPLPFVFGLRRAVIVLPANADSWPSFRLEAVMLHEMAHVRRRDILTRVIGDIACALNWFNPLVWIAAARLRAEAEVACDDAVVRAGVAAESYARELLQLARAFNGVSLLAPAIGIVGASSLASRVRAILGLGRRGRITRLHAAGGGLVACMASVAAAMIVPVPSMQGQNPVSTLNISSSGPEVSSNAAGLQARWSDGGKHSAMFVSGDVDLSEARSGHLRGGGRLLLIEEAGPGINVFEWQSGRPEVLTDSVRQSLEIGAGQLERLHGRHRGFPGSTLTGLPAWSDDPNDHVTQAGWLDGRVRYGLAARGSWRAGRSGPESNDKRAWIVLFAYDARQQTVRRLDMQLDANGLAVPHYFVNGLPAEYNAQVNEWSAKALRLLQRIKPSDVSF